MARTGAVRGAEVVPDEGLRGDGESVEGEGCESPQAVDHLVSGEGNSS